MAESKPSVIPYASKSTFYSLRTSSKYYRREATGINTVVSSMKAVIQNSKNKSFKKKNGKIFKVIALALRIVSHLSPD